MNTIEIIQSRTSWRTYSKEKLNQTDKAKLEELIKKEIETPFGAQPRFQIIDYESGEQQLGTYGFIKDAQHFIAGAVKKHAMSIEDYGYALEKIILQATELGLGTCWLGGTFTRQGFTEAMGLQEEEEMPAITPVGYMADRRGMEKIMRLAARSNNRKPWEQLSFKQNLKTPLSREDAGQYATGLEMVRLAPSASNGQPWRVVLDEDSLHFYCNGKYDIYRRLDLGIAFCHFDLTMKELGVNGVWEIPDRTQESNNVYVATWKKIN